MTKHRLWIVWPACGEPTWCAQISAIFDTRRLGYKTTLVAMAFPPDALHDAALIINEHPGVSHNYAREGSYYNLWFTLAVAPDESLDDTVNGMAARTGALQHRLMPTIRFFKIGVNFDMVNRRSAAFNYSPDGYNKQVSKDWNRAVSLSEFDIRVIRELQEDLPMISRPFDAMSERLGLSNDELYKTAAEFQKRGFMRRYSAVLHHRRAGFRANAMAVWIVDEERAEEVGQIMASHPTVTHCYQRPTFPDWPYSHFSMIHATTPEAARSRWRRLPRPRAWTSISSSTAAGSTRRPVSGTLSDSSFPSYYPVYLSLKEDDVWWWAAGQSPRAR